jgi:hypothetical protein
MNFGCVCCVKFGVYYPEDQVEDKDKYSVCRPSKQVVYMVTVQINQSSDC